MATALHLNPSCVTLTIPQQNRGYGNVEAQVPTQGPVRFYDLVDGREVFSKGGPLLVNGQNVQSILALLKGSSVRTLFGRIELLPRGRGGHRPGQAFHPPHHPPHQNHTFHVPHHVTHSHGGDQGHCGDWFRGNCDSAECEPCQPFAPQIDALCCPVIASFELLKCLFWTIPGALYECYQNGGCAKPESTTSPQPNIGQAGRSVQTPSETTPLTAAAEGMLVEPLTSTQ